MLKENGRWIRDSDSPNRTSSHTSNKRDTSAQDHRHYNQSIRSAVRPARSVNSSLLNSHLLSEIKGVLTKLDLQKILTTEIEEEARQIMAGWYSHAWMEEEARAASDLIRRLTLEHSYLILNRDVYINLINAFAKTNLCDEAENVLGHMFYIAEEFNNEDLEPNRVAINTVIGAHAKSGKRGGGAGRAKQLLKRLETEYLETRNENLKPNSRSYAKVIDAYAQEGKPDLAGKVLEHMEYNYRNKITNIPPNVYCFTSVIDAFSHQQADFISSNSTFNRSTSSSFQEIPYMAEYVLGGLLDFYDEFKLNCAKPDVKIFTSVITVWSRSDRPERVDRVRELMAQMKSYDVECDLFVYNAYLNVLASKSSWESIEEAEKVLYFLEEHERLKPDDISYNTLLKAYTRQAAAEDAEKLLQRWEEKYRTGKVLSMPDNRSYAAVIDAWANTNSKGAASKATEILKWMERNNLEPNKYCYNNVLKAWGRSVCFDENIKCVEEIWNKMDGICRDSASYFNLINGYARSDLVESAHKAEMILREAVESKAIKIDVRICNAVLASYGRLKYPHHATSLLMWMEDLIDLDTACYNSVLNAFKGHHPEEALEIFRKMPSEPSSVTYQIMTEVCTGYDDYLMELFDDCIRQSMLDERLVATFLEVGPAPVIKSLNRDDIPLEWCSRANRGPDTRCRKSIKYEQRNSRSSCGQKVNYWGW